MLIMGAKLSHLWAGVSPGVTPVLHPQLCCLFFWFLISSRNILENTGNLGLCIFFWLRFFFFFKTFCELKRTIFPEIDPHQLQVGLKKVEAQGF